MDLVMLASISDGTGDKGDSCPIMSRLGHGIRANPGIFFILEGYPFLVPHYPPLVLIIIQGCCDSCIEVPGFFANSTD